MEFVNLMTPQDVRPRSVLVQFVRLMAPFVPHFAEEVWQRLGQQETIAYEPWPEHDPALLVEETVTLPISVTGKVRARLDMPADATEDAVKNAALALPAVRKHLDGRTLRKAIYIPGKMLNLVV